MTNGTSLLLADDGRPAHRLEIIDADGFAAWEEAQRPAVRAMLQAQKFTGKGFTTAILPGAGPDDWSAVLGVAKAGSLSTWCLAAAADLLPGGDYRLAADAAGVEAAALGWVLAQYRFRRYREEKEPVGPRRLLLRDPAVIAPALAEAEATCLVRDLVNTPAADLGPAELAEAAAALAGRCGAEFEVIAGEALATDFPAVHAVGRAAAPQRGPRLVDLRWGDPAHPRIALVGKGVAFDSGGLDIKPANAMLLMKKDMGGAAHALALAGLVIGARLPVRLRLLIPAVENAISGDAFRPGDVLATRRGLSVEISNTDAEGRLILADALAAASEDDPELILDFATLTGAARVALGPELPALFSNDDAVAEALLSAGTAVDDPLWRLPLWPGYEDMLQTDVADLVNAPEGGFAGAIAAALFLRRFVGDGIAHVHVDTFAWRAAAKPGRPKGGDALGLRAAWHFLRNRYG